MPAVGAEALPGVEEALRRHNIVSAWRVDREHQDGLVALTKAYDVSRLAVDLANLCQGRVGISAVFSRVTAPIRGGGRHGSPRPPRPRRPGR